VTGAAPFPPPPLTRWQTIWRNLVAVAVGLLVWGAIAQVQWEQNPLLVVVDLGFGLLTMVAMNLRRRWPFAMAMFAALSGAVSASGSGAGIITFVSLSTRRRWTEMLPVGAVSIIAGQIFYLVQPRQEQESPWYVNLALSFAFVGIGIAIGMYIGARRELLASLEDRADRAEREQALRVAQAQANERNRIAREMHDVLAHRMSLVAMHAGALAYRDDLTAEETRGTAEVIQANSHRALTDLREILGVLRDTEAEPPNRPQPTLCDLPELIADERAAGARISLTDGLPPEPGVPESIGRAAYRMIQEGLTNARKHAPHTQVDVVVRGGPGSGLSLEVRNPIRVGATRDRQPAPRAGFGLVGLAERATLAHGRFEHGRTPEHDFVIRAWLPWPA
jgi:signal transduction histidine kinase